MNLKRVKPDTNWRQWAADNAHAEARHAIRIKSVLNALVEANAQGKPIGKMVACAISGLENEASWSAVAASCRNHATETQQARIKALAATRAEIRQRRMGQGLSVTDLAHGVAKLMRSGKSQPKAIMEVSKETSYSPTWIAVCYATAKPVELTSIQGGR